MSGAIARNAVGYRGDPVAAELPLMLLTPALFAANMVAARWAESAAIPPLYSLEQTPPLAPLPSTVRLAAGGAVVLAPFAGLEAIAGAVPDFGDPRLYAAVCFLAIVPSLGAYFCFDRLVTLIGPARASLSMYIRRNG